MPSNKPSHIKPHHGPSTNPKHGAPRHEAKSFGLYNRPRVRGITELQQRKGRNVKIKTAIEEAQDEISKLDKENKIKLQRLGNRFEKKFEKLMSIKWEDAWAKIVEKLGKGLNEEEVNLWDIVTPILNKIIYERSEKANMPTQLNLFARRISTKGDPAKGEVVTLFTGYQWKPEESMKATVYRQKELENGSFRIEQFTENVPAIRIWGYPFLQLWEDPQFSALRQKEKRPLVTEINFFLTPQEVLELYEAVEPYV